MVAVTGEAGIGKTTTVQAFVEEARSHHGLLVAAGQCLEHQGASEPYMPLFSALDRLCRNSEPDLLPAISRFAPNWLLEMPWLVDDNELARLAARIVGNTRTRMLREFVGAVQEVSATRPLLLVIEDLQWSDPSTLDTLNALARTQLTASLLLVCTARTGGPDDSPNPGADLVQELELLGLCQRLAVPPLTAAQVSEYLSLRGGEHRLPEAVSDQLSRRSDGNPLFLRLLVDDYLMHETSSAELPAGGSPTGSRVPDTLKRLVARRLGAVGPRHRAALEAAAVGGREVSPALIAGALELAEDEAETLCLELVTDGHLRRNRPADGSVTAGFSFAHALHQEVIYGELPPARRSRLHAAVASALMESYGSRAPERAGELAYHFSRAGDSRQALSYLQIAAVQAVRRYAYREAEDMLRNALALAADLEDPERVEPEIAVRDMLALAVIMLRGWAHPEAETLLKEALERAKSAARPEAQSLVLYHLAAVYENLGEHTQSKRILEERVRLEPSYRDPTSQLESHELLACSLFHKGEFEQSLDHALRGWRLYDPRLHLGLTAATLGENLGVCCQSWAALDLWYLGRPEQAQERMDAAVSMAEGPEHRYCLGLTQYRAAVLHQLLGEPHAVLERTSAAIELGTAQGHEVTAATGHMLRGWARSALGEADGGIAELRDGLASYEAAGSRIGLPYFLGLLADACMRSGRPEESLAAVDQALGIVGEHGYSHEAELHRLRGLALRRLGRADEALESLRRAVEIARAQKAASLESRAAASLSEHAAAAGL